MVFRPESVAKRLEKLREYHADLNSIGVDTLDVYMANREKQYATERLLLLIAESVIDIIDHILSARFHVVSEGYEDVLHNAQARAILPKEIYDKLKGLGGFRNVLAHEYLSISSEDVFRNYKKLIAILPEVIDELTRIAGVA